MVQPSIIIDYLILSQWKDLVARGDIRKKDLEDALMTHQYLADAVEADAWMNEKASLVSNTDYGKDEDTAQVDLLPPIFGAVLFV